jgi:hypothetical protein
VSGDSPEPDGDGEGEGEVRQPEDDRLGGELAEVAAEPGRGRDRHGAGDGGRPQDPRPDGRLLASADGRQRHERPEGTARSRGKDGDARVGQRQCESRCREDPERNGRRVVPTVGRLTDDRQQQSHECPEHQEQAQVIGRRDTAAADLDDLARPDEQAGHDRSRQGDDADTSRDLLAVP